MRKFVHSLLLSGFACWFLGGCVASDIQSGEESDAAILALALTPAHAAKDKREHVTRAGLGLYTVYLQEETVEGEDAQGEPAARSTRDPANRQDSLGWHKPKARKVVKKIAREFGVSVESMTSYTLPTFSAYMSEAARDRIAADARVKRVVPVGAEHDFSAWQDYTSGGETISWGRVAVGADDAYSGFGSPNIVYMIDGVAMIDGTMQPHNDLWNRVAFASVNWHYTSLDPAVRLAPGHANHVAGIIAAQANGVAVRGVSPGIQIFNVIKGVTDAEVNAALDWALADATQHNIYAVANISSNSERWAPGGAVYGHVQALRARMLVVQSAGNQRGNACSFAFGPPHVSDGALVVGGIDQNGQQGIPFDNTPSGYSSEPGSNWGPCVEVWGPATSVISTWNTGAWNTMPLSGTSMAAPHVAAIAARYGNTSTQPTEREAYIRSRLFTPGFVDQGGWPIRVPSVADSTANSARLYNISTRGFVGTGNDVLIGGFVISGSTPKTIVVQGVGPSLGAYGITNPLANPTLTVIRQSDGAVMGSNDDWGTAGNAAQIAASGFAPSHAQESAVMATLAPGGYTAIVSGVGATTGTGMVAAFEVSTVAAPLVNISTRGKVLTGEDVMIAGFTITGNTNKAVVIRALGPSLNQYGLSGLADPYLVVVRSSDGAVIAQNDSWSTDANASLISGGGFAPAFAQEAATLLVLPPGGYTVIVYGVGSPNTGTAIVSVDSF
jgi:hypothetical protein